MKNIKVSTRLVAGIGFILFLSIILAINSFYSLAQLTMRAGNVESLGQIHDYVSDLRITSALYKITPDEQHIKDTQNLADKIKRVASEAESELTDARNREAMGRVLNDVIEYERLFAKYVAAYQHRQENMVAAVDSGNTTNAALTALDSEINGTAVQPVAHEDLYRAATGRLVTDLVVLRRTLAYTARVFLMESTAQSFTDLEQTYNSIQDVTARLQPRLTGQAAALLADIEAGIAGYMELLRNIIPLTEAQDNAEQRMNDVFERVNTIADESVRIATELSDRDMSNSKKIAAGLTLLEIALGVIIGWFIIQQITQPLSQAIHIAQAIGNRDLTAHSVDQRGDEFGALLAALDQTRTNLRDAMEEVNGFTLQLSSAAEELSSVTIQTSAGVHSQREETEQVATAMNEMTSTVREVAQNAEDAAAAGEKANRLVVHGEQVLQGALDANSRLTAQVQESAEAMHRLNEDSTNISTVLTVINGLADQTNLLALNAAIEAARAGDVGRGFAVVADEVRNLAHRTQESTSQIEALIAGLQSGSANAVQMMDSSRSLADSTLELVEEAYSELEAIARVVQEMQGMGAQIATAAEQQSLVAEEINRNVVNVNNAADQSAAAVEETAASSQELARLGQELHNLVMRFKI